MSLSHRCAAQSFISNVPLVSQARWLERYRYRNYVHSILSHSEVALVIMGFYIYSSREFPADGLFARSYGPTNHLTLAVWVMEVVTDVGVYFVGNDEQ